jgi:HSP20 family protein
MTLPERRRPTGPARQGGWEPWREFNDAYERMGQLVRDVFGEMGTGLGQWIPPLDLEETDDAYVAEVELPGVAKDDVSVDVVGNEVHVRGEIKQRERKGILRRQTRRVGEFDFRFKVPGEIDPENVEASLEDGVLTIHTPKAAATKPRQITINVK